MRRWLLALAVVAASGEAAEPTFPQILIDTAYRSPGASPPTHVASGGNVQTAINNAACGDTITFEAGATFTGNFTLPDKDCTDGNEVYLISDDLASLPEGVRVTAADVTSMPKFTATSGNVFATASGADHYRLAGLYIEGGAASMSNLINLQAGEDDVATQASHITIDRCVVLGHSGNAQRGLLIAGAYIAVIDSHFANFKWLGVEAQAIGGWSGSGPWKIDNNYIEGAGQCVLIGGADNESTDLVPSDIQVTNNDMTKPTSWHPLSGDYAGTAWTVKNTFELKCARRVWMEGNLWEHTWVSAQDGTAVLFTVRNQNGTSPWCEVDDLTVRGNLLRDSGSGYNSTGTDDIQESDESERHAWTNNMTIGLSDTWGAAASQRAWTAYSGLDDMHLYHNTLIHGSSGTIVTMEGANNSVPGHIAKYNIFGYGGAGYVASGKGCTNVWDMFPDEIITDNVFIGITPGGCIDDYENPGFGINEATVADVGFVDPDNDDYRLDVTSDYYGAGLGGADLGVWYPSMIAIQQRVNWTLTWEANGTCVDVTFAARELASDTSCLVRAGVESETSTSGALSRLVQVCGLTPDQQYRIMVDCGDEIGGAWSYDLYTATADPPEPPGTTAMPWSFGPPASVLPTAERITVSWSATEDMASPTDVQETDCGSGCTVEIFPPDDETSYVQWCWQTAADAILACSKPQAITTP